MVARSGEAGGGPHQDRLERGGGHVARRHSGAQRAPCGRAADPENRTPLPRRRPAEVAGMIVVAHRGASGYAPENTLAALRLARERGADMAEIDVRQTADGALVVLHDASLRRTTDVAEIYPHRRTWNVRDFTLAELRRLDAGSWFGARFAGERIPTLQECLQVLREEGLGALVELKVQRRDRALAHRLAGEIRTDRHWCEAGAEGRLILQSFDRVVLRGMAGDVPGLHTAALGKTYGR